jgi:hypothetical protein
VLFILKFLRHFLSSFKNDNIKNTQFKLVTINTNYSPEIGNKLSNIKRSFCLVVEMVVCFLAGLVKALIQRANFQPHPALLTDIVSMDIVARLRVK